MAEAMDSIRRQLLEAIEDDPTLLMNSESTSLKEESAELNKNIEEEYDMLEDELRDGPIFEHEYDMVEEWEEIRVPPLEDVLSRITKLTPRQ